MQRQRLAFVGGVALLGSLAAAPVAGAASNPAAGWTLTEWVFMGPPQFYQSEVVFVYQGPNGTVQETLPFPEHNATGTPPQGYAAIDQTWGGPDNPAALKWYATAVGTEAFSSTFMGPGVLYAPSLVQTMNAEGFKPSDVGGLNPPGVTVSPTPAPVVSASPTPTSVSAVPTRSAASASVSATPTRTPAVTRSASVAATPSPAPASSSAPPSASSAPATVSSPAEPSSLYHKPSRSAYRQTIAQDQHALAARSPVSTPAFPVAPVAAGAGGLGVLGLAGWWLRAKFWP